VRLRNLGAARAPDGRKLSRHIAVHRGELQRTPCRMAAPWADGPCGYLRAFGRSASDGPESRPRSDRRRGTAWLRAGTEKADRDRLAAATETGFAESFAWAPDADRTGGGEEENEAQSS